jgi:hypothetical protein
MGRHNNISASAKNVDDTDADARATGSPSTHVVY